MQEVLPDNSSEIVVRDQNGDPSVQIPLLPPLEDDQIQDEETTEKESMLSKFMDREDGNMSLIRETETEARLLEMYKDRRIQPGEPAG